LRSIERAAENAPLGKNTNAWEIAFSLAAQPLIASRENAFVYDESASVAYQDKETNLHYNMARDYSPQEGRYIQSDPIGLGGGINTYVYVLDPLTQIDPEGLMGRAPGTFGKPGGPSSSTPAVPSAAPISCDGEWKQRGHDEQLPKTFRLCTCYWLCIPCDRPVIWSGNKRDLPSTGGQLFYDSIGGAVRTGNRCICTNKPGPEKSCKPCQQSGAQ